MNQNFVQDLLSMNYNKILYNRKGSFLLPFFLVFCLLLLVSCDGDVEKKHEAKRPVFSMNQTYSMCDFGGEYWDNAIDSLGTCYAVLLSDKPSYGMDLVLATDNINDPSTTTISHYLFLHIDSANVYAKEPPLKVIYYTNRRSEDGHQMFDSYFTNISDEDVFVNFDDSVTVSGYYKGELKDAVSPTDIRRTKIEFNKIPIMRNK